ncbi:right-handed parallel beta-helix repeat-containing protein, partial [Candidatus Micrarchaeota archaeon]|nr:right-handed parallel beta-helix repeat-containing protein [Candidatus Micrarchaeota archaeon]
MKTVLKQKALSFLMRKPRKAQTAIEYLLMIGAVIIFVIGINYLVSYYVYAPSESQANVVSAGIQQFLEGLRFVPTATPPAPPSLSCGTTINASGTYSLSSDLVCPQYGLLINASSVVLDCQHYTITGPMTDCSSPYSGIAVIGSQTGVTIQNCIVTNFCYCITAGTAWWFGELSNGIIRDNYANACYYGLTGSMSSTSFTDNNASNNVFAGVYFAIPNNDFSNTRACDNAVFDFDFVASQASNTNSYCGNNYCYQTDAWNLCTPNNPTYGNCQHCCGRCPPAVTLDAPNGASFARHDVVAFNYTPSDDEAFANATLYTNESGTWAERAYNASPLTNDTLNTIYYQVDNTGTFEWNVLVCDDDACGWAASNYSFTVTCAVGEICYCPYAISLAGSYLVTTDLTSSSGTCIFIHASSVNLDCQNHVITGPGSGEGIQMYDGNYVNVTNCTIKNFLYGILAGNNTYARITNNTLYSNTYGFIVIGSLNNSLLQSNNVSNNTQDGVYFTTGASENNDLTENVLSSNGYYGLRSTFATLRNWTIANNRITSNVYSGITSYYESDRMLYLNISHNNVSYNGNNGLVLYNFANGTIFNNTIFNNTGYGLFLGAYTPGDAAYNNITNNTINNNTAYGVYLDGYNATMKVSDNNFSYNTINYNAQYGLYFRNDLYTGPNTLYYNNLCNNGASYYDIYSPATGSAQTGSTGDMCGAGKCYQGGVYNVCVPNVGGAGNCQQNCPTAATPISSCPYTISLAGSYAVTTDLSCAGNGITVSASNVNLDCQNHVLTGPGSSTGIGISATYNYVNVTNCTVKNFQNGISMNNNDYSRLINNTAYSNTNNGIYIQSTSDSNTFQNNNASYNTQHGIYLYGDANSNQFVTNIARKNGYSGINFNSASGYPGSNNVSGNTVENNTQYGFYCSGWCDPNYFSNNRFCFNGASYYDFYAA